MLLLIKFSNPVKKKSLIQRIEAGGAHRFHSHKTAVFAILDIISGNNFISDIEFITILYRFRIGSSYKFTGNLDLICRRLNIIDHGIISVINCTQFEIFCTASNQRMNRIGGSDRVFPGLIVF